jgi:hypothetical protein
METNYATGAEYTILHNKMRVGSLKIININNIHNIVTVDVEVSLSNGNVFTGTLSAKSFIHCIVELNQEYCFDISKLEQSLISTTLSKLKKHTSNAVRLGLMICICIFIYSLFIHNNTLILSSLILFLVFKICSIIINKLWLNMKVRDIKNQ